MAIGPAKATATRERRATIVNCMIAVVWGTFESLVVEGV